MSDDCDRNGGRWPEVPNRPSFPAIDAAVRGRWVERDVFARSIGQRAGAPTWTFYEGPPTANGMPGTHHAEARTFKDVFPRYRTMKGLFVNRRGGWDCHGLPVELEVEKELGLKSKADIERFGVAEFNARCRASVLRYVDAWRELSDALGYWVDMDDAYWTMDAPYVESVWSALKRLFDDGFVFEDFRVSPYCGRCGTALSDAEVSLGYQQVEEESVFVRFPIIDGQLGEMGASLLVWTTTPWTLPGNVAVAIGADIDYELVDDHDNLVIVAAEERETALPAGSTVRRRVTRDELLGLRYRAPFDFALDEDQAARSRRVVIGPFVTTTGEGSGLVHIAPAFGAEDIALARSEDLPIVNPVDRSARFTVGPWAGQFVKDADVDIIEELRRLGVLSRILPYEHTYPFCWRCRTPLIYYAKPSWYVRTTAKREQLIANNQQIDWHPEHIREGRFGNWLANNVDWAVSRDRYWGTPLPFWRCPDCQVVTVVGSLGELAQLAGVDLSGVDPHRPFIDEILVACPGCGGPARRVTEVADAWFDSGAMPFAQWGYPQTGAEAFERHFPADFICEAVDQTRGWFYTLLAESTLLFDRPPFKTVLCLGHIVDEEGKKMSKSLGNILDPFALLKGYGADALRWLMLSEGSPWGPRRVSPGLVEAVARRVLQALWNTHYFFITYASLDGFQLSAVPPPVADRPASDRWILAELADLVAEVDASLAAFDASSACRRIEGFIDALSNWYIRRNRRRFWKAADLDPPDKAAAYHTLHTALVTTATILAPLAPFLADQLWEDLVRSQDAQAPDSVHLLDFPRPDPSWVDDELRAAMATVREVVELGRQARSEASIKNRQPLARAIVSVPQAARAGVSALLNEIAQELNIREVQIHDSSDLGMTQRSLRPRFQVLGPHFGKSANLVGAALRSATDAQADEILRSLATGAAQLDIGARTVEITADMVDVVESSRTGWQVATTGNLQVAIDTTLDDDLLTEGAARQLIRVVNQQRKVLGLRLTDRIDLVVEAPPAIDQELNISGWYDVIAQEVQADNVHRRAIGSDDAVAVDLGDLGRAAVELLV